MTRRTLALALITLALFASVAEASWYDDYDAGLVAAKKGRWSDVISKMSAAIKGNGKEGDRVRTYGVITINYHPYYYRGVAYLNTGRYDEAIADLERTSGPGPENLGSIDTLMDRAKKLQAASNEPDPEPARPDPTPVRPAPAVTTPPVTTAPVVPQVDPALRQRATAAINEAKQKLAQADARRATASPSYADARTALTDAIRKNSNAKTTDDFNAVIQAASSAGDFADMATAPAPAPATTLATTTPTPLNPAPIVPRPSAATTVVIDEHADEVREALELYFAGEFADAAARFERLTKKMPDNGWLYAFLGASLYSRYAFETEDAYRVRALSAFRQAKRLRTWKGGLPEKYFSKRIRKAFSETAG
jgi:tetratricopeptide (TPR) repeat protein